MADDLDDEWWLDQGSEDKIEEDDDENKQVKETKLAKKRKIQNGEDNEAKKTKITDTVEDSAPDGKKKKKSKRKKKRDDIEKGGDAGPESSQLIKVLEQHFKGKISAVEKDDMTLSDTDHFVECNVSKESPTEYLSSVLPDWKSQVTKANNKPGSPLLLIICPAALRAAQLNRQIDEFKSKSCKSAKLFAKHMKLAEQAKFLGKSQVHIGIGTPNRIQALIENDSLHLDKTTHVILDWSWRDVKLRKMSDIPEVRSDLFVLLKKHLIPKARSGKFKFGLL